MQGLFSPAACVQRAQNPPATRQPVGGLAVGVVALGPGWQLGSAGRRCAPRRVPGLGRLRADGQAPGWRALRRRPAAQPGPPPAYCGASPLSLAYMKAPPSRITPSCTALAIQRLRSRRVMRPQASHSVSRFNCRKPQWSQAMVRRRGIVNSQSWGTQSGSRLSHGARQENGNLLYQPA